MITLLDISRQIFLVLFFFLWITKPLQAQAFYESYLYGTDQELRAKAAVQMLNEAALVVRLKSNNKKLQLLNEYANSEELDEKQKQKYKNEAAVLLLETEHEQSIWIKAFLQNYSFSEVYFINDSDYKAFLTGKREGLFLNEEGQKDSSVKFNQLYYLVAGFGSSKQADQYSGGLGMFIMDARGNELNNPFPHFLTARFYDQLVGIVMNDGSREKRNAEKIVIRFQKKLDKFCEKVCGEILPPVNP
jgi:hypothetical protein